MAEFTGRKLLKGKRIKRRRPRIVRSKAEREAERLSLSRRLYGALGAASPVRRIDPITGEVIEEMPARKG